ncbi:MAG TPA: tetratricopeptide repeat protein [Bryobacteraceae bacterium]|nr:tetratricopeptide repeat protein [Bryobacteraceae bacterium]
MADFFLIYIKPAAAMGRILDRGRLWLAVAAALCVSGLLHWRDIPLRVPNSPLLRFISWTPGAYLAPLLTVAIVMVPAILLIRAIAGHGSFTDLLNTDYVSLLMLAMVAWAAAYLPLALVRAFTDLPLYDPLVYLAINVYFTLLLAIGARTMYGSGTASAVGVTLFGWGLGVLGMLVMMFVGPALYFLGSPLVLIYLYFIFGSRLRGFGEGLRSRQHFQQQLEISTNNPHDADAHYQLGLIYQKRRQYTDAIARFQRAIEIDPSFADAHLQLGVIARQHQRIEEAIPHLKTAAELDDKLAQNEVWRELGAAYLAASQPQEAGAALAKFTDRRPYDPEGLYWYGMALKQLNRPVEARELFERCIEAVNTMPSHRRSQVRQWGTRARKEI